MTPQEEEIKKWAYLGGILDGEGTIQVNKKNNKGNKSPAYSIAVEVGNTDKRLIDWLEQKFGGGTWFEESKKANWKDKHTWTVTGYNAHKLLSKVKDNLLLKKEQAEIAIRFYNECTKRNWSMKMKELNRKGK